MIAKKHVIPDMEAHLGSYVHLLPKNRIIEEADNLISKNRYDINDRLLHKIKFVHTDEYSFSDKMEVIKKIEEENKDSFIKDKAAQTRLKLIRDSLSDD